MLIKFLVENLSDAITILCVITMTQSYTQIQHSSKSNTTYQVRTCLYQPGFDNEEYVFMVLCVFLSLCVFVCVCACCVSMYLWGVGVCVCLHACMSMLVCVCVCVFVSVLVVCV